jgi:hypothetical protein
MKMQMADRSMENMGPVKSVAKSGGAMRDSPDTVHKNAPPASRVETKREQLKSGGPGVGAHGGMSHAVATLKGMKE